MSGLAFVRAIRDAGVAPPPMASVFGFAITDVEVGRVVFECTPDESAYNPIGVVHGGLVCTLADSVVGCAVQTTLDAGVAYTSIDLNVSYLRPVTVDSGGSRSPDGGWPSPRLRSSTPTTRSWPRRPRPC
jgi:uncharacterized protein (TIGR00369 family)